jgi:CheY-like chemotaxis protein
MVLLAENDRSMREAIRQTLERDHLKVWATADGQEALAIAEAWMVDLLVTDVAMPRLDGVGLIRAVRRLYPTLPVIITTGDDVYHGRPLAEVAVELGVEATLLKPFDLDDLRRAVRTAVSGDTEPVAPLYPSAAAPWSAPAGAPVYPATSH